MVYPDETSRTTGTTASGKSFVDATVKPLSSGVTSHVLVPSGVADGAKVVLVVVAHGRGDNAASINDARFQATRDGCLNRGWVLISSDAHGNAWSNADALNDYRRCYDWAATVWNITDTLLHGTSMGGLTVANLAGKGMIPKLRATASIDGAVHLKAAYDAQFTADIKTAYGIAADGSDYATKTAGFDPSEVDPSAWSGQRIFLEASPNDGTVIKTTQSDVFYSRVNPVARVTYMTGSGAHVATDNFRPADVLSFYDTAITQAAAVPADTGNGNVFTYNGSGWGVASVYTNDGTGWRPAKLSY